MGTSRPGLTAIYAEGGVEVSMAAGPEAAQVVAEQPVQALAGDAGQAGA